MSTVTSKWDSTSYPLQKSVKSFVTLEDSNDSLGASVPLMEGRSIQSDAFQHVQDTCSGVIGLTLAQGAVFSEVDVLKSLIQNCT